MPRSVFNITPAEGQQMNRSNDPETTRELDEAAPEQAMASRRERLTGQAVGVAASASTRSAPSTSGRESGPIPRTRR